jgi:NitT/TauT family transport system permease protein
VTLAGLATATGTRGRRQPQLLRVFGPLDLRWRIILGVTGVASVFALWLVGAALFSGGSLIPTPAATWAAFWEQWHTSLAGDLAASSYRIAVGYTISVAIGIVLGMAMGAMRSVEAFFEPPIGFLRYIPATALVPVFLLLFGIDETPKVWLIVVGTVFFNILMMADAARAVPRELVNAAYTLGAGQWTVLRRVVFRHSVPGIVDATRVNLAAAWLMLVVAELLAANEGLGFGVERAHRFHAVPAMFALLMVFGVIGLVSDLLLRALRSRLAPWAEG